LTGALKLRKTEGVGAEATFSNTNDFVASLKTKVLLN